jgi:hypothetical protein
MSPLDAAAMGRGFGGDINPANRNISPLNPLKEPLAVFQQPFGRPVRLKVYGHYHCYNC